jgi:hypothetical protein
MRSEISVFFAVVYALMETFIPGPMGIEDLSNALVFPTRYAFSFYNLVGTENQLSEGVHVAITNLSVIEGIISQLFIIFVVGRLLTKD